MVAPVVFSLLILLEIVYAISCFIYKTNFRKEKAIAALALFGLFVVFVAVGVIEWSFRWYALALLLFVQAVAAAVTLLRKQETAPFKPGRTILNAVASVLLVAIVLLPAFLFPQSSPPVPSGANAIGTTVYTWTDASRDELFTPEADQRSITVQFWYPAAHAGEAGVEVEDVPIVDGTYPLVIFSHGAFGYRQSNHSTYMELASHGYVVGSIDHPYHAFVTRQADGSAIIANTAFLNDVMNAESSVDDSAATFENSQQWLELRTEDMKFALAHINELAAQPDADPLFAAMNLEHVGVLGHSLGGAASAQTGRELEMVDAVIVLDGTMLGEQIAFADGVTLVSDIPYPKPILNVYSESHHADALAVQDTYANTVMQKNAADAYRAVVNGTEHLNFTDLPMVTPFLASLLGTGTIDAEDGMMTTNAVVLAFFDYFLKGVGEQPAREQVY